MKSKEFDERNRRLIGRMNADQEYKDTCENFFKQSVTHEYHYHFSWLGLPIIQFPQDILAMQEIIWNVKPDLIIETGIARGGSLIFYASMLELLENDGLVVGIDIDIRSENKWNIENHPLARRIKMLHGSSTDPGIVAQAAEMAEGRNKVLVALDSLHTQAHVARELELYAPLVTKGSYLVVFDTVIQDLPDRLHAGKPWNQDDNPKLAVHEFLSAHPGEFAIDHTIEAKLMVTVAPDGYLKRIA